MVFILKFNENYRTRTPTIMNQLNISLKSSYSIKIFCNHAISIRVWPCSSGRSYAGSTAATAFPLFKSLSARNIFCKEHDDEKRDVRQDLRSHHNFDRQNHHGSDVRRFHWVCGRRGTAALSTSSSGHGAPPDLWWFGWPPSGT